SDFTIMAPGVSENPLAVFEVLSYSRRFPTDRFKSYANEVAEKFTCPFYLYVERENSFDVMVFRDDIFVETEIPKYSDICAEIFDNINYPNFLKLQNFTVFRTATFDFGRNINVLIGANGTGKTHLLKLLYSIFKLLTGNNNEKLQVEDRFINNEKLQVEDRFINIARKIFGIKNKSDLVRRNSGDNFFIEFSMQKQKYFVYGKKNRKLVDYEPFFAKQLITSGVVFLPTRELLSIYPGFISIFNTYKEKMPYDQTYYDTVSLLGLPSLDSQNIAIHEICSIIENSIGATFYLDYATNRFMMQKRGNGKPFEVDMAAEGWRKLGEILQLLKVGAIAPGSILFWDEPEANQNSALIKVLAQVIAKLGSIGVQIFLTTHSLFLLRELEYLSKLEHNDKFVRYIGLHPDGSIDQSYETSDLRHITSLDEELLQSDRILSTRY
ncbi:MAG: AAA family ATPase, partial [Lentisphaeria bacterium]|nr:AAA family ATPase [Lentisphaeria bacterium]